MKNFFAAMLGTVAGLVICGIGCVIIGIGLLFALISSATAEKPVAIETGSYLVLDLSVNITDAPPQMDGSEVIAAISGEETRKVWQLREFTRALRAAATDDRIAGVFMLGQFVPDGYGTGFAVLKEAREALHDFKKSGKPVVAYLEFATVREAYIAAAADEFVFDPYGILLLPGLASEPVFLAGALEKFGVGVQITRVGKYKSAIEPFTRRDMSPESREQLQKLLDDIWSDLRGDLAIDRGLRAEQLQALVDAEGLIMPASALKNGLVDRLAYRDEVLADLKRRTGREGSDEPFKQISLEQYAATLGTDTGVVAEKKFSGRGTIGIVYAEGAIVDGEGDRTQVGGVRYAREIRRMRQDDDVKAIVLRVNSPGGSATASEHILRELRLAAKEKPVIVSMGAYAASGGYWISAYGDRIFAEPGTITGSIGVFGVQFDIEKLAGNMGITFDRVKTGRFADAVTISRPKTPEELAIIQRMVDWVYEEFVAKVAEARGLPREQVHEIAQGRVWSGAEALKLGLVDEIGGLDAAIASAAHAAEISHYDISEFPKRKTFNEFLAEAVEGLSPARAKLSGPVGAVVNRVENEVRALSEYNDPRGIYVRLPVHVALQ